LVTLFVAKGIPPPFRGIAVKWMNIVLRLRLGSLTGALGHEQLHQGTKKEKTSTMGGLSETTPGSDAVTSGGHHANERRAIWTAGGGNQYMRPTLGISPNELATTQNSLGQALLSPIIEVVR
jgi:hypothetical protein